MCAAHSSNDSLSQLLWLLLAIHPTNNPSYRVDNGRLMNEVTPSLFKNKNKHLNSFRLARK